MQPNTPNPSNPIADEALRDLTRRKDGIKNAFAALDDGNVRSIPEVIFVRDFLPLFSGQSQDNRKPLLDAWYLIAGTPFIPVNVVNAAGQLVVQVPPLHENVHFNLMNRKGETMGMAMSEAKHRGELSPRLGDGILGRALSERMIDVKKPNEPSAGWKALFAHYGIGPKAATPGASSPADESDFEM